MRDKIIVRLEQIRRQEKNFPKSVQRWRNLRIEDQHVSDLDFDDLTDEELLIAFEKVIRRLYIQM